MGINNPRKVRSIGGTNDNHSWRLVSLMRRYCLIPGSIFRFVMINHSFADGNNTVPGRSFNNVTWSWLLDWPFENKSPSQLNRVLKSEFGIGPNGERGLAFTDETFKALNLVRKRKRLFYSSFESTSGVLTTTTEYSYGQKGGKGKNKQ